jgi:Zn-dependent protease
MEPVMTSTTPTAELSTGPFAPWVEWQQETCRGGRTLITAVNARTGTALFLEPADIEAARRPGPTDRPNADALRRGGFLANAPAPAIVPLTRPPGAGLVWSSADRFVRRLHHAGLHRLFTRRGLTAQVVLAIVGTVAFVVGIARQPLQLHAEPGQIPAIIVLGLIAVVVHELGHALVTVRHGRHVRLVGVRLHLGSPAFYVESLDALLLTRRQRLAQVVAGPWAEWLVNAAAALVLLAVPADSTVGTLLHRFVIINAIGIATNLLPFVGLDGSLILGDLIREPDLAVRSRVALLAPRSVARRDRWILGYALANMAVAGVLVVSAGFFWWQLFGGLVQQLWSLGPVGVAVVITGTIAMSGLVRRVISPVIGYVSASWGIAGLVSRLRFRLERRWRVRAIKALRVVPEVGRLDLAALGVLAGQLRRVCAGTVGIPAGGGHLFVERTRSVVTLGGGEATVPAAGVLLPCALLAPVGAAG